MRRNWVVTLSYAADPDMDTMDRWEDELDGFDATIARVPDRGVDVVLHADDTTLDDALKRARRSATKVVPGDPIGIAATTEEEHLRRADAIGFPKLMSAAEIAVELGISRQRVHQLRSNADFPGPLADLRSGPVWDARDIRRFARQWARQPGRPAAVSRRVR